MQLKLTTFYEPARADGVQSYVGPRHDVLWACFLQGSERAQYVTFKRTECGLFSDMFVTDGNDPRELVKRAKQLGLKHIATDGMGGIMYTTVEASEVFWSK